MKMTRSMLRYNLPPYQIHFIYIAIFCLIFVSYIFIFHSPLHTRLNYESNTSTFNVVRSNKSERSTDTISTSRTLVVYVYGKTHRFAEENLVFFIRTAVRSSDDADYYFILQRINDVVLDEKKLPALPSNAHYVQHENKCFDLGTIGWFLSNGTIDTTKYKYFVFLNSSVRGPFIAAYYDSSIWYTIYTRRLKNHIKLVGCTISCAETPHVQSYLWAMNLETLDLFLKNSTVFTCHRSMGGTIREGEIGASQMILDAGFGIDSLMIKYQGVDFRYNRTMKCVDKINPTFNKATNGITLDPYEVVFVKMKGVTAQDLENQERVRVYEKWLYH